MLEIILMMLGVATCGLILVAFWGWTCSACAGAGGVRRASLTPRHVHFD